MTDDDFELIIQLETNEEGKIVKATIVETIKWVNGFDPVQYYSDTGNREYLVAAFKAEPIFKDPELD